MLSKGNVAYRDFGQYGLYLSRYDEAHGLANLQRHFCYARSLGGPPHRKGEQNTLECVLWSLLIVQTGNLLDSFCRGFGLSGVVGRRENLVRLCNMSSLVHHKFTGESTYHSLVGYGDLDYLLESFQVLGPSHYARVLQ